MNYQRPDPRLGVFGLILAGVCSLSAQAVPGVPEPGLVLYGSVTNATSGQIFSTNTVTWTVSGGGSTAVVASAIAIVNGKFFYVARIPYETRFVPGTPPLVFSASPNTLPLSASNTTYTRAATVSGVAAAIVFSSVGQLGSFTFGASERGRLERVNLAVELPTTPESFDEWAFRFFGTTQIDPDGDADGDGASNRAEYVAGTDPLNDESYFKIAAVLPAPVQGLSIQWLSVTGRLYSVERATHVAGPYVGIASNVAGGSGATLSVTDSNATQSGPNFYRLRAQ